MGFFKIDKPLVMASYHVAYKIAQSKKPHTIDEELIKPCALKMMSSFLGTDAASKLDKIHLSNNVVQDLKINMSGDLLDQIICDIKKVSY